MVISDDNETAPYQDPDYLHVKEMVCAFYQTINRLSFGSGWKLFTVSGKGAR